MDYSIYSSGFNLGKVILRNYRGIEIYQLPINTCTNINKITYFLYSFLIRKPHFENYSYVFQNKITESVNDVFTYFLKENAPF